MTLICRGADSAAQVGITPRGSFHSRASREAPSSQCSGALVLTVSASKRQLQKPQAGNSVVSYPAGVEPGTTRSGDQQTTVGMLLASQVPLSGCITEPHSSFSDLFFFFFLMRRVQTASPGPPHCSPVCDTNATPEATEFVTRCSECPAQ